MNGMSKNLIDDSTIGLNMKNYGLDIMVSNLSQFLKDLGNKELGAGSNVPNKTKKQIDGLIANILEARDLGNKYGIGNNATMKFKMQNMLH